MWDLPRTGIKPTSPALARQIPYHQVKLKVLVTQHVQLFVTPMDCSPLGYSVHGILQARILEWVAMPFSGGSSQPRDQTWVSCVAGKFFTIWVTWEAHQGSPQWMLYYCNNIAFLFFFSFIFISWRLITLQYCSGFCHTLTWISHGVTCVPHPAPPSHLPLY